MSLKEKLSMVLTRYAKEATPEFRNALHAVAAEFDEKRKAFDFCLEELAITKNHLSDKDMAVQSLQTKVSEREDEIAALRDKVVMHERGVEEMEAILLANDDQIKDYMQEREKMEMNHSARIEELSHQLHSDLENRLQVCVQRGVLEGYVQVCNNLLARNQTLAWQVSDYEEKINKLCCPGLLGLKAATRGA